MRLIDADAFIANLKDYTDKPMTAGLCATFVELSPTAYDIGKVIEELKSTKGYACYGMKCDECKYTHDCFEGEKSQEMAIDDAIEIVKQGGVSDDVCEWKSIRDGEFIQNPHTRRTFSNEPSMQNVYCNTCGKKIKVVE